MKRQLKRYSLENMEEALELVKSKRMTQVQAANHFGIPRKTIGCKLRGERPVIPEPKTVLHPEEEDHLVSWLLKSSRRGEGRTREQLLTAVQLFLKSDNRDNPFKDSKPGKKWYTNFRKRHPEIVLRNQTFTSSTGQSESLLAVSGSSPQSPEASTSPSTPIFSSSVSPSHSPEPSTSSSAASSLVSSPSTAITSSSIKSQQSLSAPTTSFSTLQQSLSAPAMSVSLSLPIPITSSSTLTTPVASSLQCQEQRTLQPSSPHPSLSIPEIKFYVDALLDHVIAHKWTESKVLEMRRMYKNKDPSQNPEYLTYAFLYSQLVPETPCSNQPSPEISMESRKAKRELQPSNSVTGGADTDMEDLEMKKSRGKEQKLPKEKQQ